MLFIKYLLPASVRNKALVGNNQAESAKALIIDQQKKSEAQQQKKPLYQEKKLQIKIQKQ